MRQNNVFLFYYALIATTILLTVSFFFIPNPQKILNIILLAPVVVYVWINAIFPDFFDLPKWSPKLGAVSIVFSILGIFSYFVAMKLPDYFPKPPVLNTTSTASETKDQDPDNTDLKSYFDNRFDQLDAKIDSLGKRDFSVLGVTVPTETASETASVGQIEAKDANLTEIPVYETASVTTKVVSTAKFGIVYQYSEKATDWYKISEGWVEARWFNEVSP